MSIITTWEAVPSRLFSLYASLLDSPSGETKERLEALATPPSLRNKGSEDEGPASTSLFNNALREAFSLKFVELDGDTLRVPTAAQVYAKTQKGREKQFRSFMLDTLFDIEKAKSAQQSGFMVALAWFLTKSPLKPFSFRNDPFNIIKADLGEFTVKTDMKTVSDYQNLLYWARYLGFATFIGGRASEAGRDARWVFPDPFSAIESVIPTIFADETELPIELFMTRLSSVYPVFEGSAVRQEIDQVSGASSYANERRLSQATSLALRRLENHKYFEMKSRADAPVAILDFGLNDQRISHLAIKSSS
jgi:hypothetical protein